MLRNDTRCIRCITQKKACEGGLPCARCLNSGSECIPETQGSQRLKKNAARRLASRGASASGQGAATTRPQQLANSATQQEDDTDGGETDQPPTEQEEAITAAVLSSRPRLTSLRTQQNGPDLWPNLSWSYVGNGQFCLNEGFARVMAKKQIATRQQQTEMTEQNHWQRTRASGHRASVHPALDAMSQISQAQQQQEIQYLRLISKDPPSMSDRRQGKQPLRDPTSNSMPPPPRSASRASRLPPSGLVAQGDEFMQPFGYARQTHASEAQYETLRPLLERERPETPPLPNRSLPQDR